MGRWYHQLPLMSSELQRAMPSPEISEALLDHLRGVLEVRDLSGMSYALRFRGVRTLAHAKGLMESRDAALFCQFLLNKGAHIRSVKALKDSFKREENLETAVSLDPGSVWNFRILLPCNQQFLGRPWPLDINMDNATIPLARGSEAVPSHGVSKADLWSGSL